MQRYLRQTIDADGNNRGTDADRGITDHITVFPRSRAHMPWQNRIKSDRNRPRETNLPAMSMAAQKQIESSMCSLAVDFWRV